MIPTSMRAPMLVTALLLVAACGSPSTSSDSNSKGSTPFPTPTPSQASLVASVDACTLVSAGEASQATGTPLSNLAAIGGVQIPGACIYGSSSGKPASVIVFAQVYPDETAANAVQPDQVATALAGQMGITNAHSVTGIGDKAFEYTATGSAGAGIAIFVFKANVVMMIAVDPTSTPSTIEQMARTAVGRLVFG